MNTTRSESRLEAARQRAAARDAAAAAGAPADSGTPPPPVVPLRRRLEDLLPALTSALPTGVSPARFLRVLLTEVEMKPRLKEADPRSVLGAVMTAASLGLEFGPLQHAYLVPFKSHGVMRCQLIIGYKGYIDLARRSGQLRSIIARPVYQGDEFRYRFGTVEDVHHVPTLGARGQIVAYYGIARVTDGDPVVHIMTPDEINLYRARSMAADDGPWVTDPVAMAQKTVVRRMVPWLPLSVDVATALADDERVLEWNGLEVERPTIDTVAVDVDEPQPAPGDEPADPPATDDPPATGSQSEPNDPSDR